MIGSWSRPTKLQRVEVWLAPYEWLTLLHDCATCDEGELSSLLD